MWDRSLCKGSVATLFLHSVVNGHSSAEDIMQAEARDGEASPIAAWLDRIDPTIAPEESRQAEPAVTQAVSRYLRTPTYVQV